MQYSYWEIKSWFQHIDFAVIGSGIVGLSCALQLRELHPKAKIIVFEKGLLPQGASTKNAGFACFGSVSELLDDRQHHSEEELLQLVTKRWEGLQLLRTLVGDKPMDFQQHGGYELFFSDAQNTFEHCRDQLNAINQWLAPLFATAVFAEKPTPFGLGNVSKHCLFNRFEGQIDTGKMMDALLEKARMANIRVLNNAPLMSFEETNEKVILQFPDFSVHCRKLFLATNGFSSALVEEEITPARAQVLITEPIEKLPIRGTFHLDRGYYYFRNVDNRILLGGGRNLDSTGETTQAFGLHPQIQAALDKLLHNLIFPNQNVKVAQRWSGIMGMGPKKSTLIKPIGKNSYCGIRLGGMGVAIGAAVGKELAHFSA